MASIFISHSSRDSVIAAELKAWLQEQGFDQVFLDLDKDTGLGAGRNWERQLYEAIERCHAVIVIVTPAWLASKWCFAEFTQARALGKVTFPLILTPDSQTVVGPELQSIQSEMWDEKGRSHLSERLRQVADEIARGYRWDSQRPPWPGIASFEGDDAAIFFGRDPEIREVAERLMARRLQGGDRLVMIVGASGSGKSSLLKAGVLPWLQRDKRQWLVVPPFRPGEAPLTRLTKALAVALGTEGEWQTLKAELSGERAREALLGAIDALQVGVSREATILLSIDQFEEVFTLASPAERVSFLRVLSILASREHALPVLVVTTVRSDLFGEILRAEEFSLPHEVLGLGPLPLDRLTSVIEGPAQVAAISLENGLSARILKDVNSADSLPLLAFALRELNERYGGDKRLEIMEYEALGDPAQGLNPLENTVRRKAEEVLGGLRPDDQELTALKEAFVGSLVKVNEEGVRLRRPARLNDLPGASRRLVDGLVGARLLTVRQESSIGATGDNSNAAASADVATVEVAHEALFTAWPLLKAWLDEEQDFLIGRRQIEEAERTWRAARGDDQEKALMSGLLLERARRWSVEYPHRLASVREFALASIGHDDAMRALREAERGTSAAVCSAHRLDSRFGRRCFRRPRHLGIATVGSGRTGDRSVRDRASGSRRCASRSCRATAAGADQRIAVSGSLRRTCLRGGQPRSGAGPRAGSVARRS